MMSPSKFFAFLVPALCLVVLASWFVDQLPEVPSIEIGTPMVQSSTDPASTTSIDPAPTTSTTFERPPMNDSYLSPQASADDSMTLEENNYLPDGDGQYLVLREISEINQIFPQGATVGADSEATKG